MSWTDRYWDLLDRLYWSPQYIGLKSIPRKNWTIEGTRVSIPVEMTNANGPLYRRLRSGDEYWTYVRRQEEVFNYLFDLTFAVLPGDVIAQILDPITGAGPAHSYEMFGTNLRSRYGASHNANITTPDGFFVAPNSIAAIELKFNAKASLDQLAKYAMLFTAEQELTGSRERLDLIYVLNKDPHKTFKKEVGVDASGVDGELIDALTDAVENKFVRRYLGEKRVLVEATLSRLNVHCITWSSLCKTLDTLSDSLGEADGKGDRTLKRLIDGLITEIRKHPLSNVEDGAGQ